MYHLHFTEYELQFLYTVLMSNSGEHPTIVESLIYKNAPDDLNFFNNLVNKFVLNIPDDKRAEIPNYLSPAYTTPTATDFPGAFSTLTAEQLAQFAELGTGCFDVVNKFFQNELGYSIEESQECKDLLMQSVMDYVDEIMTAERLAAEVKKISDQSPSDPAH